VSCNVFVLLANSKVHSGFVYSLFAFPIAQLKKKTHFLCEELSLEICNNHYFSNNILLVTKPLM